MRGLKLTRATTGVAPNPGRRKLASLDSRAEPAHLLKGELAWTPQVSPIAKFVRTHHGTKASSSERNHHSSQNTSGPFGRDYRSPAERGIWLLFNFAIDSKLRGCDVVSLKLEDVAPHGLYRRPRNGPPTEDRPARQVRNHRTDPAGDRRSCSCVTITPERLSVPRGGAAIVISRPDSTRAAARRMAGPDGLDPSLFGTHSIRRTQGDPDLQKTGDPEPCNCCWATPRSKAPFATLALRSTMRWQLPNRLRSD